MEKNYYQFNLDDYSAPSCTSGIKHYYGTVDNCKDLLDVIKDDKNCDAIKQAFTKFLSGDKDCKHYAGFVETQLAKSGRIIKDREFTVDNIEFRYENSYGFYYDIKADKARFSVKVFKNIDVKFTVIYYATITDAKLKSTEFEGKWSPLGNMIWGHLGIIKVNKQNGICELSNTLAVLDTTYDTQEEAEKYLSEIKQPDLQSFFEDAFGVG